MRDADIRRALHLALQTEHSSDPDTLIRHEVGVNAGKRRIDVVLVNGELTGYEIKSDEDTLARLAGQSEAYVEVLDRAILVTSQRHLDAATDMSSFSDSRGGVPANITSSTDLRYSCAHSLER